ncbi:formate--phosphoribosylaminoimidazolecarboxamide ligase, partial [Candidatus Gracilibacteria bacterium]|nr:formate--phosphoribosylaminoimidazolecarboxamide ligase [Candidatus Gracilibacteria bacterium]
MPMSTNQADYIIGTLGSHSALQILKGAKDEGFKTLAICIKGQSEPYRSYAVADEIIEIDSAKDYFKLEQELIRRNVIIIPHGSLVSGIGPEKVKEMQAMYYGTKDILEWESNRTMEREWLTAAGINMPKVFNSPEEIDRTTIVKFHGAKGGSGYFLAHTPEEFYERIKEFPEEKNYAIQEYIVGVPIYAHFFYSKLNDEIEVMSFDKRYESNADSVGRIAAKDQLHVDIQTSYTITGNVPIVIRESLLPQVFEMGRNVVKKSQEIVGKGLFG